MLRHKLRSGDVGRIVIGALVLAVIAGTAWVLGPGARSFVGVDDLSTLSSKDLTTAVDAVRGRVLQICAGLIALGALVFTARTYKLNSQGHVTDRYSKAVSNLGSEAANERVGGIYALERVMADSPRDHSTVVEVLCAFVRQQAPLDAPIRIDGKLNEELSDDCEPTAAVDVQAALTVLGRRPKRPERNRLDLSKCDLSGTALADGRFDFADFTHSLLRHTGNACSSMRGANFYYADLRHATLGDDISGANFVRADLRHANLAGVNAVDASFGLADIRGTYFTILGSNADGSREYFDCQGLVSSQFEGCIRDSSTLLPAAIAAKLDALG